MFTILAVQGGGVTLRVITTPESLYLVLTSRAAAMLAAVETVIVDEIHSLVATKRGAHLFVSLERLEELRRQHRPDAAPLQRIGLSATLRPLEEIARLLGGGEIGGDGRGRSGKQPHLEPWHPRPVRIVDAGRQKAFEVTVEVPIEDMAAPGEGEEAVARPGLKRTGGRSIWPSIYPRLVDRIRAHRSTMIFVNSRRLAERLASALNEAAGEEIALAHHGSIAREKRQEIENRLKGGELPAIVATSSLELGIDMAVVDLVIQIEAPPSVAAGRQRIGRAGHRAGAISRGIIFPKYRGDLLACAAATALMREGKVEETFYPRHPLDVLAQQIVAIVAMAPMPVEGLYRLIRRAAPFAELRRASFDGVLDMLAGRYPSDEFAGLRPRIVWDRAEGMVRARAGAQRLAVANAGTIPDRGLYGVFLAGDDSGRSRRVGELDEEMVFESRVGDVFLLGASSWRIQEITHDRVLVTPAPGEPAKMPFWHGDRPGRPAEFGRAIGKLARTLLAESAAEARARLQEGHGLDDKAAANLLAYLEEQRAATGDVPSDRVIVIERFLDEAGDWRVCILSPYGARIHAPWATAVIARWKQASPIEIDALWSDDGMVFRLPQSDQPPEIGLFLPAPDEAEEWVMRSLGQTSLFAARFRENAARALLLPRRAPGHRSPLWSQRKRAANLLAVAAQYDSFPIILETYRECLQDVFDLPGLVDLLKQIAARRIQVITVDARSPSPFASALLFSYVGNFIYDGDAPLAERRAQILAIDQAQLKELLGEAELRELLDAEAVEGVEKSLQRLDGARPIRNADDLRDLLSVIGDLTEEEIRCRMGMSPGSGSSGRDVGPGLLAGWLDQLEGERRVMDLAIAGENRFAVVEDAARFRDALGLALPSGLPAAFLEPVADPLGDLVSRYARTHGPFHTEEVAARFGLDIGPVFTMLRQLAAADRVVEGEFRPGGRWREWCDAEVLRALKRRSLAALRKQVEPVETAVLARFLVEWQGLTRPRAGLDALLSVIEQLQGAPIPASVLETEVLPTRIQRYHPADLDTLCGAGEVIWRGLEPLGAHDGRMALYLPGHYPLLAPPVVEAQGELATAVRQLLATRGALFFVDLASATGAFPGDLLAALWALVWSGEATNDTLAPLRSLMAGPERSRRSQVHGRQFRSRRPGPPGSEGRWSLLARFAPDNSPGAVRPTDHPSDTVRRTALASQLLARFGVLTREAVHAEGIAGGFAAVYEVLKAMEERGRVRRGYFVAGLGATQFALPGAEERLRALRQIAEGTPPLILAATDPANPYGAALAWPEPRAHHGIAPGAKPQRIAGAQVLVDNGILMAWIPRTERNLLTFLPMTEPEQSRGAATIARALASLVETGSRRAVLVSLVDGEPVEKSVLAKCLLEAGFTAGSRGYLKRRTPSILAD